MNGLLSLIVELGTFILGLFEALDHGLRRLLTQSGVPGDVQTAVLVVVAILFFVAALRLFGGVFRVLIVLLLLLFLVQLVLPGLHVPAPHTTPTP